MRLSITVTMTPFSKWDQQKKPDLLAKRMKAVEVGQTTSHLPHEFNRQDFGDSGGADIKGKYKPPALDETKLSLIRGP